jgi:XTP/dITP diphosphohydrolase
MALPPRIALATKNDHKLAEIIRICSDWPVEGSPFTTVTRAPSRMSTRRGDLPRQRGPQARAIADALGIPALADDSGIEVDALGGRPGPRSARFAGPDATDERNLAELIRSVRGIPAAGLTARYRCVAAFVAPGGELISVEGLCEGALTTKPRGTGGFGYDPIFVPVGWDRTMAELEPAEKDRISHRGRAFRAIRALLTGD